MEGFVRLKVCVGKGLKGLSRSKVRLGKALEGLGRSKVRLGKGLEGLGRSKVRLGKGLEGLGRSKVRLGQCILFHVNYVECMELFHVKKYPLAIYVEFHVKLFHVKFSGA